MNKYVAVIQDSFREAMASRVLWLLLVLITLLLAAAAPLGYLETRTTRLVDGDFNERFLAIVRDGGRDAQPTPARRIWEQLDGDLRELLGRVKIPGVDPEPAVNPLDFIRAINRLQRQVNQLIERRDFYDERSFTKVTMTSPELRTLRDKPVAEMSDAEAARFNRLLLEAAFPEVVRVSPPTSIQFRYLWMNVAEPLPLSGESLHDALQDAVRNALRWFLGALGILVAILVTAPIIPQTFDPGSLHLLLSKPVARWLLLLAKYLGGCAFIAICASYLITGLWLILGVRFGIWDPRLLFSIPIYLFVFSIYYAVSTLVGVIYRSPIVCIAMTVLFWAACFLIGWTKSGFENLYWNKSKLIEFVNAGETLVAVNEMGTAHAWDEAKQSWQEIFVSPEQRQARGFMIFMPRIEPQFRAVGPVYDAQQDRLLAVHPTMPPGTKILKAGRRAEHWAAQGTIDPPLGTRKLLREPDGGILIASTMGLFRISGDPVAPVEPIKIFGVTLPLPDAGPFEPVGPADGLVLANPADVAIDPGTGRLAAYTRGTLRLLARGDNGRYQVLVDAQLTQNEAEPALVGVCGASLLVARRDGLLEVRDAATLALRRECRDFVPHAPRFVATSPHGRWAAIVFHHGRLALYDAQQDLFTEPKLPGQGDVSAAGFTLNDELLVAERATRVSRYDAQSLTLRQRYDSRLDWLATSYRLAIVPLYTVFPKPGELDQTFAYLLSGAETERGRARDLESSRTSLDPWGPVWSSGLFVAIVLVLTCLYFSRQEF